MHKNLFKVLWFTFPLTKLVYMYIALSSPLASGNQGAEQISYIFLLLGVCSSVLSVYFGKKLHEHGTIIENKIIKTIYRRMIKQFPEKDSNTVVVFNVFTVVLGLGETAALFGLVQYMLTGNLVIFLLLIGSCLIAWLCNYPGYIDFNAD